MYLCRVATYSIFIIMAPFLYFLLRMERNQFKQTFNNLLESHIHQQLASTTPYHISPELTNIYNFLATYSQSGKRIRPYLVFLTYKLYGGKDDTAALQF